jgi:hypothetical protein
MFSDYVTVNFCALQEDLEGGKKLIKGRMICVCTSAITRSTPVKAKLQYHAFITNPKEVRLASCFYKRGREGADYV